MGYPTKPRRPTPDANARAERLEALIGERGKDNDDGMAVTKGDVAALGFIAITATHVAAAPTQAEHNALVDDMKAIASVLNRMGAKFTGL